MQEYFLLIPLLVIGLTPLYLYYKDKKCEANKEIQKNKGLEAMKQNNSNAKLTREILDLIEENNLLYYCDLLDFLKGNYAKHFQYATKHVFLFNAYLESRQRVARDNKK